MTQQGAGRRQPRGQLQLQPQSTAARNVSLGFEHGCPGPNVHLGMRFQGKPGSAVDGNPFPVAEWEQSINFVPNRFPIDLAGVPGVDLASLSVRQSPFVGPPRPWFRYDPTRGGVDRNRWLQFIRAAPRVTAQWFLVHDTAGGSLPTRAPTDGSRGIHMFLQGNRTFLHHDFSTAHNGTRFEQLHPEFVGKIIHLEIVNRDERIVPNPPDVYTQQEYLCIAYAYVWASYRARSWLTVTCHLEIDRGIDGGHCDPRGFVYARLYERIGALVPSVAGKTFGILQPRIGNGMNGASMRNTFPAQYGAVEYETRLRR